jgi:hypothetical protein
MLGRCGCRGLVSPGVNVCCITPRTPCTSPPSQVFASSSRPSSTLRPPASGQGTARPWWQQASPCRLPVPVLAFRAQVLSRLRAPPGLGLPGRLPRGVPSWLLRPCAAAAGFTRIAPDGVPHPTSWRFPQLSGMLTSPPGHTWTQLWVPKVLQHRFPCSLGLMFIAPFLFRGFRMNISPAYCLSLRGPVHLRVLCRSCLCSACLPWGSAPLYTAFVALSIAYTGSAPFPMFVCAQWACCRVRIPPEAPW